MSLKERIKNKTVRANKKRDVIPTLVLIDNSGSMKNYIEIANEGVRNLVERLKADPFFYNSIDLCIASFNDEYNEILPFELIPNIKSIQEIEKSDKTSTLLGAAVSEAVKSLAAEKQRLKDRNIPYNQPILVIFSDGVPQFEDEADTNKGIADIQNKIVYEHWGSYAFLAGNYSESSMKLLQRFTSRGVMLCQNDGSQLENIVDIFDFGSIDVIVADEARCSNITSNNLNLTPPDDFLRRMQLKRSQQQHIIEILNAENNTK